MASEGLSHSRLSEQAARSNFPAPLSSFVGRRRELGELTRLFERARLVTLTGPGGAGKTRLALEYARQESDRFADGSWFVDLAPVSDPTLLPDAILVSFGVRKRGGRAPLDPVVARLGESRVLLVLDSFERLSGTGARVVSELLGRCSNLCVLATSRSPLHVRGEHEMVVEPFGLPGEEDSQDLERLAANDAVAMFVERADAVSPGFALTPDTAPSVVEICRRLDGLPLALELAAARIRVLTPAALASRLGQRLPLLTEGPADAPSRQRTLRDTIAWSYDLLASDDQTIFSRASVFSGAFSLPAAEAILPDSPAQGSDTLHSLIRLSEQALIRISADQDGAPRFGLLDSIREFAGERLGKADALIVRDRHLAYFLALAEDANPKLRGTDADIWLTRLANDQDNLRAALVHASSSHKGQMLQRLAAALGAFWRYHGDPREGARWLDEALEVESGEPRARAAVLLHAGRMAHLLGDLDRAEVLHRSALAASEAIDDREGMAWALNWLGVDAVERGAVGLAAERYERALALASDAGSDLLRGGLALNLGDVALMEGHPEDGRRHYEAASRSFEAVGDRRSLALARVNLGLLALEEDDHISALNAIGTAVKELQQLEDREYLGWATLALADVRLRAGDFAESGRLLCDAARLARQTGDVLDGIEALERMAQWLGRMTSPASAVRCWAAAHAARAKYDFAAEPRETETMEQALKKERATMGQRGFDETWAAGSALGLAEALELGATSVAAEKIRPGALPSGTHGRQGLTPREHEVLTLLAAGRSDAEIAEALFISKKTASVHVANVKAKVGAESRVEMALIAVRLGLGDSGPEAGGS